MTETVLANTLPIIAFHRRDHGGLMGEKDEQ